VDGQALAANIERMSRFCADHRVSLAPHAKTTMTPQILGAQLDAGAWGLTVATVTQAQVCRRFGVRRLLLANEIVDRAGIAWLGAELRDHPELEVVCYVDSVAGVALLDEVLAASGGLGERRLAVLVELGHDRGRTGCRTPASAAAVADAVGASRSLEVAGVAGYEGGLGHDRSPATVAAVRDFCLRLVELATALVAQFGRGADRPLLISAGGSAYPDVVTDALADAAGWATVLLRSGCYVTHDDGVYARISPFTDQAASPYALAAALELWAPVLSRPQPDLAIIGAGRRDVGFDQGFPLPRTWRSPDGVLGELPGARVTRLDDQHGYLELRADTRLEAGDLVGLGVSHPCTTIDRWPYLVEVDAGQQVTGVFGTFF
jgi:D-serine dehydratase